MCVYHLLMHRGTYITALGVLLALAGCTTASDNRSSYETPRYSYEETEDEDELEIEDKDYGSGLTYQGYPCTEDCSGHEAGYEWAWENDIDDPYDCDSNSQSFTEGCWSYVQENYGDE